ncbi:MAG: hypothetical protein K8R90_06740 [Candidatus Cloacimonetes bacterium]|nr:hypothetical protein [Candidatus Cloacimonadota bacterium]
MKPARLAVLVVVGALLLAGCASTRTSKEHLVGVEQKLEQHDYAGAASLVEAARDTGYTPKERVAFYLDLGMLQHYSGDWQTSSTNLTDAEYSIEDLFTKSVSKAALSLLLNDNALDYCGEDYEDIYLNVFKSLNYVHLGQLDGALVEIRRINGKVQHLEDKYADLASGYGQSDDAKIEMEAGTTRFHVSALAQWLSMLLYRADRKYDDARIASEGIARAFSTQSQLYPFPQPALDGYLAPAGAAQLDIIAFVGRSPDKKAKTLYVHTEEDWIIIATTEENPRKHQELEELNAFPWVGVEEGYHFKFQLPYLEAVGTDVGRVRLLVDGQPAGDLAPIESIEQVALDTWKLKEPIIYLKTIIRATLKGLVAERAKQRMTEEVGGGVLGFAARIATDIAVDATENADLRISRFFPSQALVGEFEVAAGSHQLEVEYYTPAGRLLFTDDLGTVEVRQNGLNLVETFYLK